MYKKANLRHKKTDITSACNLEKLFTFQGMVPVGGLEPPRIAAGDFESPMSTNSITLAQYKLCFLKIFAVHAKDFESAASTNSATLASIDVLSMWDAL